MFSIENIVSTTSSHAINKKRENTKDSKKPGDIPAASSIERETQ